jgi:hypothetical protein
MKSYGDGGSPCLNPRLLAILEPGKPLRSTRVDAVDKRAQMQVRILSPNPSLLRTSIRKGHSTVSKAFVMSNFSTSTEVELL